jgi:hypothetical protein
VQELGSRGVGKSQTVEDRGSKAGSVCFEVRRVEAGEVLDLGAALADGVDNLGGGFGEARFTADFFCFGGVVVVGGV